MHCPKCGSHNLIKTRARFFLVAFTFLAAFALLAVFPALASASTWRGDDLLRRFSLAPWKIGPFRIEPQIVLGDFGYDSNIYTQPDAVSDYSFTAGPQINAFLTFGRKIFLSFSESPRYVYYMRTASERAWNNYLNGSLSFLLNRFFIQLGANWMEARQRWNYEIDLRPRINDIGYNASILWQPTRSRTSFELGFRQSRYRYENLVDDPYRIADRLDRDQMYLNLIVYNQLTARTRAFIDVEYGRASFVSADNPRDSLSYTAYGGFEFSTLGRVRGRIRLGYKMFHSLVAGITDYKGLVGDSNISVSILRSFTLRGSYRRDVQFSTWSDDPYFVEESFGAGISYYFLRRRFRLDYDYSQLRYNYPIIDAAGSASGSRKDRVFMNTVGLFFRIGKSMGIGVRAGRYDRSINVYDWKTSRDFVGLNLTYEF